MKEKFKRYRDSAKLSVFLHINSAILAVITSGLVATVINYYYQVTATEKNVNIFSGDLEVLKLTALVSLMSVLANLPLSYCAARFYLIIARKAPFEKATMKELFAPFLSPSAIIKGSLLMLISSVLTLLGAVVLVFPVYFTYCMAVFITCDKPEISAFSALRESRRMMKGHKWTAFRTTLPILAVYALVSLFLNTLYFISFFVISIVEAVFFVTLAVIYDDIRSDA